MAPAAYNRRPSVLGPGGGFVDASESRILVCMCVMPLAQEGLGGLHTHSSIHFFSMHLCELLLVVIQITDQS